MFENNENRITTNTTTQLHNTQTTTTTTNNHYTSTHLLKQPRHALLQIAIKPHKEKSTHIPQQGRKQNGPKHRRGIIRAGIVHKHVHGGVAESRDPSHAKDLRKDRVEEFARRGGEEQIPEIVGEAVDDDVAQHAGSEEDVVAEHGRGPAHEDVGECGSRVGCESGLGEGVEPVHGFGVLFVGGADGDGSLDSV